MNYCILKTATAAFLILYGSAASAQKADILNGPVTAFTKTDVKPANRLGKQRLYHNEKVFLEKGDWLVAKAGSRGNKPVSIDVYDRSLKKYVQSVEDTVRHDLVPHRFRTELVFQAGRTDTFDVLFDINYKQEMVEIDKLAEDSWGTVTGQLDTVAIDFTLAVTDASWQPKDSTWGFSQRLSYICNNWTAGFSTIPKTYDKEEWQKSKTITAYYPLDPVALDDRMGVSLQLLSHNSKLVYFMYTEDKSYAEAKRIYDELSDKLKRITDKATVSDLSEMKRINELATTYFALKIPKEKRPFEFFLFGDAGKEYDHLPVNLFLFGDKQKAKVLIVVGEPDSDIYDLGS